MWTYGTDDYNKVRVPNRWEIACGAKNLSDGKHSGARDDPLGNWLEAERRACDYVCGQLFFRLREHRALAPLLAAKLVHASLKGHDVWMERTHTSRPEELCHDTSPCDMLAGLGWVLTGNKRGAEMMFIGAEWLPGKDTAWVAYKLFECNGEHGHHHKHWRQAGWLLKLAAEAKKLVCRAESLTHMHYLMALGGLLFRDPAEMYEVFYA